MNVSPCKHVSHFFSQLRNTHSWTLSVPIRPFPYPSIATHTLHGRCTGAAWVLHGRCLQALVYHEREGQWAAALACHDLRLLQASSGATLGGGNLPAPAGQPGE